VLYDALLHLGYDEEVPIYHYRLSIVDGLDIYETNVTRPLNPTEPWMGTIISVESDTTIKRTTHVTLTSMCECRLTTTAVMPIALFLIQN
jgi:hypothetical protein